MNDVAPKPTTPPPDTLIGWREYVVLPEWGVSHIKAKADTGARTSAIDVANIEEIGPDRVRFDLVIDRGTPVRTATIETDIVRRTRVKSSFGAAHDRLVVRTLIQLGPVRKSVDLSLVCRRNMLCRMLLGRAALEPEFVVDPGRRYLFGLQRPKTTKVRTKKKKKKRTPS